MQIKIPIRCEVAWDWAWVGRKAGGGWLLVISTDNIYFDWLAGGVHENIQEFVAREEE